MTHMPSSEASRQRMPAEFKKGIWYSVDIPSIPEEILDVEETIIEALSHTSFSDTDVFAVRLALDEALANAMKHGNDCDHAKRVFIRFCIEDDAITVSVRDEGPGFDCSDIPDPTIDENLDIPSGRGLLLMKSYMDSVVFSDRGNEVTMVKRKGTKL